MLPSKAVGRAIYCTRFFTHRNFLGMVATATRTILENLDRIPDEDERTKVAIICFDVSLYFFSLPVGHLAPTLGSRFNLFA